MKKRDRIWLLIYLSILSIVIAIVVSFFEQKYWNIFLNSSYNQ